MVHLLLSVVLDVVHVCFAVHRLNEVFSIFKGKSVVFHDALHYATHAMIA